MDRAVTRIGMDALRRNELLGCLEPGEMDEFLALAKVRQFDANQILFQKADPGDCLYAVISGRVGITTESEGGKAILLNMMKPGDVLGEIALLDGKPRTANAVALEDSQLLRIDRADFMPFLERHPQVAIRLMGVLCDRLRWTSDIIEDTIFLDIPHRLAKRLVTLGSQYGRSTEKGLLIDIRLSQESLGQMLGSTRESINKGLKLLEQKGLIETTGGYIRVVDEDALEEFAERSDAA
jgi:CRP-like cAMP-binding protein